MLTDVCLDQRMLEGNLLDEFDTAHPLPESIIKGKHGMLATFISNGCDAVWFIQLFINIGIAVCVFMNCLLLKHFTFQIQNRYILVPLSMSMLPGM